MKLTSSAIKNEDFYIHIHEIYQISKESEVFLYQLISFRTLSFLIRHEHILPTRNPYFILSDILIPSHFIRLDRDLITFFSHFFSFFQITQRFLLLYFLIQSFHNVE